LEERLSGPEASAVEAHVQACSSCQQTLDELSDASLPSAASLSTPKRQTLFEPSSEFLQRLRENLPNCADAEISLPGWAVAPPAADIQRVSVPGYEVVAELGRGGTGVVYKAWQTRLGRLVALKFLLAGAHTSPDALARFRVEAVTLGRLHHPHIVQIHEVGEEQECPYLTLEYVEGGSLARKLAGTPLPARQAAELVETMARAVHYAHEHGVIHRDLTPGNVLLSAEGSPKITDFGLAKLRVGGANRTATGEILGTPSYMAPEQAEGKKGVGLHADVYALGAILYECLTGRPPFKAETPLDTLLQVAADEPVPPRRLQPKVPHDLETICLKCLRKETSQRYASALELAEDLRRFLAHEPIRARPVPPWERTRKWVKRRPALAALLAFVIVLIAGSAAGGWVALDRLRAETSRALKAEADATHKGNESRGRLWRSLRDQARAAMYSRRPGQRFESLRALAEAAPIAREQGASDDELMELRALALRCMALRVDLRPAPLAWRGDGKGVFTLSRDGAQIACANSSGAIRIHSVADNRELAVLAAPRPTCPVGEMQFSPDGRYLMATHGDPRVDQPERLAVWEWRESREVFACKGGDDSSQEPPGWGSWSVDSRRIAVYRRKDVPGVRSYDLATGARQVLTTGLYGQTKRGVQGVVFHPDGERLILTLDNAARVHDAATGTLVREYSHPLGVNRGLALSDDGRFLAVAMGQQVYVWDLHGSTTSPSAVLRGHRAGIRQMAFSHASDMLLTESWDDTLRFWEPQTGRELASVPRLRMGTSPLSPDDRLLLAAAPGAAAGLWELPQDLQLRELAGISGTGRPGGVAFHPNRPLAAVLRTGAHGVQLWDLEAWEPVCRVTQAFVSGLCFSPDGNELFTWGEQGLLAWRFRECPTGLEPDGKPRLLAPPGPRNSMRLLLGTELTLDRLGEQLLAVNPPGGSALFLNLAQPGSAPVEIRQAGIWTGALSPDGRWAVTATRKPTSRIGGVTVWDTTTGQPVVEPLHSEPSFVGFSPDGRWLVAGDPTGYRFWHAPSWQLAPERTVTIPGNLLDDPGVFAFSPDGRVMAISHSREVRLLDAQTGHLLGELATDGERRIFGLTFSADGSRLAVTRDNAAVQLWDLGAVRRRLRDMQLDWDLPEYPPGGKAPTRSRFGYSGE
jgi:WD40 repeat protein